MKVLLVNIRTILAGEGQVMLKSPMTARLSSGTSIFAGCDLEILSICKKTVLRH